MDRFNNTKQPITKNLNSYIGNLLNLASSLDAFDVDEDKLTTKQKEIWKSIQKLKQSSYDNYQNIRNELSNIDTEYKKVRYENLSLKNKQSEPEHVW